LEARRSSLIIQYLPALWLIALATYILAGTPLAPFHGDESTQIYMSRDYAYQFLQHDMSRIRYSNSPENPAEQYLRLINGAINKYLIGLAWHLGGFQLSDVNEQWDWGAGWDYNQRSGHIPTEGLLLAARWPSALLLAAGAAVMFALGRMLGGPPAAYLASLYYALNPPLLLNGRRAMMEGSAAFFGLLVVLAGVWYLRQHNLRSGITLGIVGGLALASKHTTVFAVGAVFGVCVFDVIVRTRQGVSLHGAASLITAVLLALLTFYLLNPGWWGDPIGRAGYVLQLRQALLDTQVRAFGGYASFGDRLIGFARQTLLALPQYYEAPEWSGYIGGQIAAYEASVWRGVSIGGSLPGALALSGMIGAGAWALVRNRRLSVPLRWLFGVWALAVMLSTLLLTPIEWQRYYLPAYPTVGLLAALGVTNTIGIVRQRLPVVEN